MAEVQTTPTATEAVVTEPKVTQDASVIPENLPSHDDTNGIEALPAMIEPSADDQLRSEAAAAESKETPAVAEKIVEPITEGQLSYKGPGLLKSLIPSKKEFWLTDAPTSTEHLSSYMRGEKPEIAHPVAAWASQTGRGLLFFNKKGDTNQEQPGSVLALYEASELKKQNPHEILFKIGTHEHTLKATSDAERDGWYMSIEKAVELGKASKDEVHESVGYKEELEKLNKPHVAGIASAAASKRSRSKPKKSTEIDRNDSEAVVGDKKKGKSRSTSRGVLNRFKSAKDESDVEKKETDVNGTESKSEEPTITDEVAAAAPVTAIAGAIGLTHTDNTNNGSTETPVEADKTAEQPKMTKRNSIFGKMAGWGGAKTPTKEKDVELKPEVPAKDDVVTADAPVLPETATTEHTDAEAEADKIEVKAAHEVMQENPEIKKETVVTPSREKSGFLSGFMPRRGRSVSPSANLTKTEVETPKAAVEEPAKIQEPNSEVIAAESVETPEDPAKTETPTANKRQSFIGSLSRRASQAVSRTRGQKKENIAPTNEVTKEESAVVAPETVEKPITNGETMSAPSEQPEATIGDVVPSAISVGHSEQPLAVTASA